MPEGGNGSNALRVPVESVDFTVTLHHNIVSGQFEITCPHTNRLVILGMLRYALDMMKREDAKAAMQREIANAPRVITPGLRGV